MLQELHWNIRLLICIHYHVSEDVLERRARKLGHLAVEEHANVRIICAKPRQMIQNDKPTKMEGADGQADLSFHWARVILLALSYPIWLYFSDAMTLQMSIQATFVQQYFHFYSL